MDVEVSVRALKLIENPLVVGLDKVDVHIDADFALYTIPWNDTCREDGDDQRAESVEGALLIFGRMEH